MSGDASFRLVYVEDAKNASLHEADNDDPTPPHALTPSLKRPAKHAPLHKVGGVGDFIQRDPRGELTLESEGLTRSGDDIRKAEKKGLDVAALIEKAESWQLLWQVDSDETVGFRWLDEGRLYVFITDEDLEKRRFERARVELQCT
jgi:hypothetical protein